MRTIKKALIASDFSQNSKEAIAMGERLAQLFGFSLHLVHVISPIEEKYSFLKADLEKHLWEVASSAMDELAKEFAKSAIEITTSVEEGDVVEKIFELVERDRFDLLIIGTHGEESPEEPVGSTAEALLLKCPVPTLAVRSDVSLDIKKILVPTDFSDTSKGGFVRAIDLQKELEAPITLMHAFHLPSGYERLGQSYEEAKEIMRKSAQTEMDDFLAKCVFDTKGVGTRLDVGMPARTVAKVAAEGNFELIVCGSHGFSSLGKLLVGSVAERIFRIAKAHIFVERSKEHFMSFTRAIQKFVGL
ncbi:MAG: universal stress protein [Planctomycetes bacterium]|nr:universal stress protein [Planctomycetota bacterium]